MEKIEKKSLLTFGIIGLLLLIMVIGATYAYFAVSTTNSFGTQTIEVEAEDVGSVAITNLNSTLSLNLTAKDMMQDNYGTYCATKTGKEKVSSIDYLYSNYVNHHIITNEKGLNVIAKTVLTGSGTYRCTYNMTINNTGNMYTKFQSMNNKSNNQIFLNLLPGDGTVQKYDFNTSNLFPITYNGTIYTSDMLPSNFIIYDSSPDINNNIHELINDECTGIEDENELSNCQDEIFFSYMYKYALTTIGAEFCINNEENIDQSALEDSTASLTFSLSNFNCTAMSDEEVNQVLSGLN